MKQKTTQPIIASLWKQTLLLATLLFSIWSSIHAQQQHITQDLFKQVEFLGLHTTSSGLYTMYREAPGQYTFIDTHKGVRHDIAGEDYQTFFVTKDQQSALLVKGGRVDILDIASGNIVKKLPFPYSYYGNRKGDFAHNPETGFVLSVSYIGGDFWFAGINTRTGEVMNKKIKSNRLSKGSWFQQPWLSKDDKQVAFRRGQSHAYLFEANPGFEILDLSNFKSKIVQQLPAQFDTTYLASVVNPFRHHNDAKQWTTQGPSRWQMGTCQ